MGHLRGSLAQGAQNKSNCASPNDSPVIEYKPTPALGVWRHLLADGDDDIIINMGTHRLGVVAREL